MTDEKKIIITGASRGLGYALAKHLARSTNANLYLVSRNAEALAKLARECGELNRQIAIVPVCFDLMNLLSGPDSLPSDLKALGHVDVLVNNAGAMLNKPFGNMEAEEIHHTFSVNVFAPALLIRYLLPAIIGGRGCHVVNIGSMGGYQDSAKFAGLSAYSASKAALAALTQCLAEEYKGTGVAFNCLALGAVHTQMLEEAFPGYKAPLEAEEMAEFIGNFALTGHRFFNGKILAVSSSTP